MGTFDNENIVNTILLQMKTEGLYYMQYLHAGFCATGPCGNSKDYNNDMCCAPFVWCVHASNKLHTLPKHFRCDCYYKEVKNKPLGSISNRSPSPDVWLRQYGHLPDYYISKEEAESLGWRPGKNLAHFAPGKMIGGEIYKNKKHVLPEENGRVWYHCDINYESGKRNNLRLYYSNDGLMFYSPNHLNGQVEVYWIK